MDSINSGESARRAISSYQPKLEPQEGDDLPFVGDIMDHSPVKLDQAMQVYDAIEILLTRKISSAAVVDADRALVGILSEKDCLRTLLRAAYDGLPGSCVADYMTREVNTVSPNMDLTTVAGIFLNNSFRRVLVVDDDGRLIGQLTRSHLLHQIHRILKDGKRGSVF